MDVAGIFYWFFTVIFGSFDVEEGFLTFAVPFFICFSGIAVLLTLAFLFKFILKLVER